MSIFRPLVSSFLFQQISSQEERKEQSQTTVNQFRFFTFGHAVRSKPVALVLFEASDLSSDGFEL